MRYQFSWEVIASSLPQIGIGVMGTVELASASITLGLAIGIVGVAMRFGPSAGLRWLIRVYVDLMRNTPMLVQLYFIYYGLPKLGILLDSYATALAALSIYCGAYVLEIMRAGVEGVHRGQIEAARALGLSETAVFTRIVLPQAFRVSLPALGGQAVAMVKLSSLASVIGAVELTDVVVDIVAVTYRSFELYAVAGLTYLALTLTISAGMKWLEVKLRPAR
jgi:polar amino acid transport system permease protein